VACLRAFEDAIDIAGRAPKEVGDIGVIGHQATDRDEGSVPVNCQHSVPGGEGNNFLAMSRSEGVAEKYQPAMPVTSEPSHRRLIPSLLVTRRAASRHGQ